MDIALSPTIVNEIIHSTAIVMAAAFIIPFVIREVIDFFVD